jgi:hypothetical protein
MPSLSCHIRPADPRAGAKNRELCCQARAAVPVPGEVGGSARERLAKRNKVASCSLPFGDTMDTRTLAIPVVAVVVVIVFVI